MVSHTVVSKVIGAIRMANNNTGEGEGGRGKEGEDALNGGDVGGAVAIVFVFLLPSAFLFLSSVAALLQACLRPSCLVEITQQNSTKHSKKRGGAHSYDRQNQEQDPKKRHTNKNQKSSTIHTRVQQAEREAVDVVVEQRPTETLKPKGCRNSRKIAFQNQEHRKI